MPYFPSLTWLAQEDATIPIAPYTVDFSQDQNWSWKVSDGNYLNRRINPAGVMVDNTANSFAVNVAFGPLTVQVPGLVRAPITLPTGVDSVTITAPSTPAMGLVPVTFYIKEPAPGATGPAPASSGATANPYVEGANHTFQETGMAVVKLVDPTANKNALILRRAMIAMNGGANTQKGALFVTAAAPANTDDHTQNAILYLRSETSGQGAQEHVELPYPIKFGPNLGLWIAATGPAISFLASWDVS